MTQFVIVFLSLQERHALNEACTQSLFGTDAGICTDDINKAIAAELPAVIQTDTWKQDGRRDYGPRVRLARHDFAIPNGMPIPDERAVRAAARAILRRNRALPLPPGTKWLEILVDDTPGDSQWERMKTLARRDQRAWHDLPLGYLIDEVKRRLALVPQGQFQAALCVGPNHLNIAFTVQGTDSVARPHDVIVAIPLIEEMQWASICGYDSMGMYDLAKFLEKVIREWQIPGQEG